MSEQNCTEIKTIELTEEGAQQLDETLRNPPAPKRLLERASEMRGVIRNTDI